MWIPGADESTVRLRSILAALDSVWCSSDGSGDGDGGVVAGMIL